METRSVSHSSRTTENAFIAPEPAEPLPLCTEPDSGRVVSLSFLLFLLHQGRCGSAFGFAQTTRDVKRTLSRVPSLLQAAAARATFTKAGHCPVRLLLTPLRQSAEPFRLLLLKLLTHLDAADLTSRAFTTTWVGSRTPHARVCCATVCVTHALRPGAVLLRRTACLCARLKRHRMKS